MADKFDYIQYLRSNLLLKEVNGDSNPLGLPYVDTWHQGQYKAQSGELPQAIKLMNKAAQQAEQYAKETRDQGVAGEAGYYRGTVAWLKKDYPTVLKYINDKSVKLTGNDVVLKKLLKHRDKPYVQAYTLQEGMQLDEVEPIVTLSNDRDPLHRFMKSRKFIEIFEDIPIINRSLLPGELKKYLTAYYKMFFKPEKYRITFPQFLEIFFDELVGTLLYMQDNYHWPETDKEEEEYWETFSRELEINLGDLLEDYRILNEVETVPDPDSFRPTRLDRFLSSKQFEEMERAFEYTHIYELQDLLSYFFEVYEGSAKAVERLPSGTKLREYLQRTYGWPHVMSTLIRNFEEAVDNWGIEDLEAVEDWGYDEALANGIGDTFKELVPKPITEAEIVPDSGHDLESRLRKSLPKLPEYKAATRTTEEFSDNHLMDTILRYYHQYSPTMSLPAFVKYYLTTSERIFEYLDRIPGARQDGNQYWEDYWNIFFLRMEDDLML
jgi:hypothetical protein